MDESCTFQNRRSRRSNVLLSASLEYLGQALQVKLRNLSSQGALVESDNLPVEGTEVLFRRKELSVRSRVAWVNGNHAGIAFDTALPPEQVLRHVPAPRPRITSAHRRPGVKTHQLSPEERKLVESWVWSPTARLRD